MTMWAFAKFLLQSRWTRLFWFILPTIWLGGNGSKLLAASTWRIGMLNMTTEPFLRCSMLCDSRLVHAGSRAFLFLATSPATIKDQSQDRYKQRIVNLKIYFRNVGLVNSNCKSITNCCKHVLSTNIFRGSHVQSYPHRPGFISMLAMASKVWGLDGPILRHFPASKWQVLVQCKSPHLFGHWHESLRFCGLMFWGEPISAIGEVVGKFFFVVKLHRSRTMRPRISSVPILRK